jgi:hypothetical protein
MRTAKLNGMIMRQGPVDGKLKSANLAQSYDKHRHVISKCDNVGPCRRVPRVRETVRSQLPDVDTP